LPNSDRPRRFEPERALAAAALAAICVLTFANVLVRYFTDFSFAATEELTITLLVVLTLLGSATAARRGGHIAVGFFVERLPKALQPWTAHVASLAGAIMFGLLVWLGGQMAWDDYRFEVTSPSLGLPQWLYTIWLPILSALVAWRFLARLWSRGA
jgi:TRAP-type C4-dicarboxylate transport system permease small subunit